MKKDDLNDTIFTLLITLIVLTGIGGVIKGGRWIRSLKQSLDNPVDSCEGYESREKCNFCKQLDLVSNENNFKNCMKENSIFEN
tara:strand:+ start:384 stop:635 length:252 start_codon:yes stop_codon:yes gene_type:complete